MVRKYQLGKPITTGGSGYFPLFNQETIENIGYRYITGGLPISIVRQRLYNNLYPHGYNDVIGRFRNAVVNNEKDRRIREMEMGNKEYAYLNDQRDPIFAEYLNIPEKDRHKSEYKLVESKYLPTIGKSGSKYYASPTVTAWREKGEHLGIISHLISSMYNSSDYSRRYDKPLNIGESRVGVPLSLDLGKHTISRGYDDKGEYVSYYDKWDLSPFGGSAGERDDSRGIGTPVSFYDRIYLDDYYGVKTPTHSTYLPEVIVKGRKHKKVANARKWKHKDGGKIDFYNLGGWFKNTFNNVSSFLGSDTGKSVLSIGSGLIGLGKGISNSGKIADATNEAEEAINALEAADRLKSFAEKYAAILLEKLSKPDIDVNGSPIHTNGVNVTNEAYNLAVNTFNFDRTKYNQMRQQLNELAKLAQALNSSSMAGSVSGLIDSIGGIAGSLLNKKSITPKTSLIITGNPNSSKQVITTNSGMSGTVDDWRKAILG